MYGSGLRVNEVLRLRVKDLDFGSKQITVPDGKGGIERFTLLPQSLIDTLNRQIVSTEIYLHVVRSRSEAIKTPVDEMDISNSKKDTRDAPLSASFSKFAGHTVRRYECGASDPGLVDFKRRNSAAHPRRNRTPSGSARTLKMVGRVGIEPTTGRLKAECSTSELTPHLGSTEWAWKSHQTVMNFRARSYRTAGK